MKKYYVDLKDMIEEEIEQKEEHTEDDYIVCFTDIFIYQESKIGI